MTRPRQLTVMVVDDHELVRSGMCRLLEGNAMVGEVHQANSGELAVKKAAAHAFDLVLMDISLPGIDGLEASRQLLDVNAKTSVVIVSGSDLDTHIVRQLLDTGVRGYVTKGSSADEMDRAIREVMNGGKYLSADVAQKLATTVMGDNQADSRENPFDKLTSRELEIIELLMQGQRNRLIGEKLHISEKTVSTHRSNSFEKLGISTPSELVRLAIRYGMWSDA